MNLALFNWMRIEPLEMTLKRLVKYGYQSINFVLDPYTTDRAEIREMLKKYVVYQCNLHPVIFKLQLLLGIHTKEKTQRSHYL